ncbi:hypothetical protein FO519_006406 [Halicephalobus sp. NKZ332]|nr:hypothetical protein FO519_006406 [Halicephalobus sp. NKZ332]
MLACFCNNFSIVECLLLRNHIIVLPHQPDCICSSCRKTAFSVEKKLLRLDTYRAISSDAFLWLATRDPLLAAINLAKDLESCLSDSDHKEIYSALLSRVQAFSGDIIQQCRTLEEVNFLLEQKEGASLSESEVPFPRVRMAADAHMKPFLCHMNLQMTMVSKWMGAWSEGKGQISRDFGRIIRHTLLYPILALLHASSGGVLVKSFKIPYARFDFAFLYIFVISFFCWIMMKVTPLPKDLHRKHWVPYDPVVLYDVFFGAACLMAFWRIFYYIQLHRNFGSTVVIFYNHLGVHISIGKCVGEVVNYFVIMSIVIVSFGLGLSTILQPYAENYTLIDGRKSQASITFPDVVTSVKNLFWGFFGYMSPIDYSIHVGNTGINGNPMNHYVTKLSVEFLTSVYYIVTVITLLNLMVSLLVKKADEVLEKKEIEWRRYKSTRFHHYSTIQKIDSGEKKETKPLMAFMNARL